ncbi:hypothetical protein [Tunturiibacter gelidiferens]|uniref:hypothetical protein n=1 Tax=Tunturiibacter gelidiferens TaxID=3069689 RepID=UPI003D9B7D79
MATQNRVPRQPGGHNERKRLRVPARGIQILGGNVFTDWQSLITAMSGVEGRKILEFDDSLVAPTDACKIPVGTWSMKDVVWAGFGPRPGFPRTTVRILSGAVFTNFRMIGGQILIVNQATGAVPSPVSDFGPGVDLLQIGLRDDCGNTQLVNQFEIPMFDLGDKPAFFFLQNCLFGMPTPDVPTPTPLIRHSGQSSKLIMNLLGQNQTGPNVVSSENGASVLFAALSSAAQVAPDQTSITSHGGTYTFGPQGRIQRRVIPRPPDPPATASQAFSTPNVLVRCDGTHAFTQDLPSITTGFKIGLSAVDLYTGGQEVVVAEVAGGKSSRFARLRTKQSTGIRIPSR